MGIYSIFINELYQGLFSSITALLYNSPIFDDGYHRYIKDKTATGYKDDKKYLACPSPNT